MTCLFRITGMCDHRDEGKLCPRCGLVHLSLYGDHERQRREQPAAQRPTELALAHYGRCTGSSDVRDSLSDKDKRTLGMAPAVLPDGAAPGAQPHLVFDLPALIFRHLAVSNCLDVAVALRKLTMAQYRADKQKAAAPAAPVNRPLFAP
jgi:hypothetical protein